VNFFSQNLVFHGIMAVGIELFFARSASFSKFGTFFSPQGGREMRKLFVVAVVLVALTGMVQAAEITLNPNPPTIPSGENTPNRAPNITQSVDPNTVATGSIACTAGGVASDNEFLRRFFLNADHGITIQYTVTSVDAGIESTTDVAGNGIPVTVTTYSIANGAAFTYANMTSMDANTVTLPDAIDLQILNWVVGGVILDPSADDLIIGLSWADVTDTGDYGIWPGSNAAGQTQPSYLASVGCGIADPMDIAGIGFPDMHLVFTVNGDEAAQPTATPDPGAGGAPIPTMNRWGMLAMIGMLLGIAVLVIIRRK